MKLSIKKEFFDAIKAGTKTVEYRDAHLTFICEETGEVFVSPVLRAKTMLKSELPAHLRRSGLFDDNVVIAFDLNTGYTPGVKK